MARRANRAWVKKELAPFLENVFRSRPRIESWEDWIATAEPHINDRRFGNTYSADFPASIEALRLLLINKKLTTYDERKPYVELQNGKTQDSVTIFLRHAINHGTYHLHSHGSSPCREFPRGQKTEKLLPFYAAFEDVEAAEEEQQISVAQEHGRHQSRRPKAQVGYSGAQRDHFLVAGGQQFPQPIQTHRNQPQQYCQQVVQPVTYYPQQPQQYGQQFQQPFQLYGQQSHGGQSQVQSAQSHIPPSICDQQIQQPLQPHSQQFYSHGQGQYQPLQPYGSQHSYIQEAYHPFQYHPQHAYTTGQWVPHPSGGWPTMSPQPVPQMSYSNVNGAPRNLGNQMNNWQAATCAYNPGMDGNAPTFEPRENERQEGPQNGNS